MKKIKIIFIALLTVAIMCLSLLTACQNKELNKVVSLLESTNPTAIDADIKLEIDQNYKTVTQTSTVEILCVENLQVQEADLKINTEEWQGSTLIEQTQSVYVRGEELFITEAYTVGNNTANKLLIPVDSLISIIPGNILGGSLNIEGLNIQPEQSSLIKLIKLADKYGAVKTKANELTLDVNKLIYKIAKDLIPVLEGIDEKTTVGNLIKNGKVKKLINSLAGDDTALDFYNGVLESEEYSLFAKMITPYKPEEGQRIYDYIKEICETKGVTNGTIWSDNFGRNTAISEYNVYKVIKFLEGVEAEKFLDDLCDSIEEVKEEYFEFELISSDDVSYALKDVSLQIQADGENVKTVSVNGEIIMEGMKQTQVQSICLNLKAVVSFLETEQNVADLTKCTYLVTKECFYDGRYICDFYASPNTNAISSAIVVVENEAVTEFILSNGVSTEYDAEADCFRYTVNGYSMYATVEPGLITLYQEGSDAVFQRVSLAARTYLKAEELTYEQYLAYKN